MARPTKYSPRIVKLAEEYLNSCNWKNRKIPTVEGLSIALGIDDDTVVEWEKLYPKFSATIKRLKAKQKSQLISDGFYGGKDVNATMAIFLLKVNHGMIEMQHTDITSGGKPIGNPILGGATKDVPSDYSNK